ncbi:MAG: hypothetical protein IT449_17150 [Phycisphaerales bacterium]|nr:hypothetical protein [Phycisphaerales bacterium]
MITKTSRKKPKLVDAKDLFELIQKELDKRKNVAQISAHNISLMGGAWFCVVSTDQKNAGKIAEVLADVEAFILEKLGVNVALSPVFD